MRSGIQTDTQTKLEKQPITPTPIQTPQQTQVNSVTEQNKPYQNYYHGTNADFENFDNAKQNYSGWLSKGFYFTKEIENAKNFGKNIKKVNLDIKNPLILKSDTINNDKTVNFCTKYKRTNL